MGHDAQLIFFESKIKSLQHDVSAIVQILFLSQIKIIDLFVGNFYTIQTQ